MSSPSNVTEYYFSNHYRVLVVEDGEAYTVSVDVYRDKWGFTGHVEKCIRDVCILFKEIPREALSEIGISVEGVVRAIVIGVRVGGKEEAINVKWILVRKPTYRDVEALYRASWRLIGCGSEGCIEGSEAT